MKIIEFNKKQQEFVIKTENLNDLWTLYNIITADDIITARTHRRVILKEGTKGERKPMTLTLKVETLSFHEFSNRLRVKGTILSGPEDYISYGTYHTFNISINDKISIKKEKWLRSDIQRVKKRREFDLNFKMLIIALEKGISSVFLITNYSQKEIASIRQNIPGKRYSQKDRNKVLLDFYESVKKIIEENYDTSLNLIIVCGPGSIKDDFIKHLRANSKISFAQEIKSIQASSGTKSAIYEILKSSELKATKKEVKLFEESSKIQHLYETLAKDPDLIVIGINEVKHASNQGAIEELYIVDILIRGINKTSRLLIEDIMDSVEKTGGKISILNSELPTGQELIGLGEIVGLLRYKM